jgi:hypothetical protein
VGALLGGVAEEATAGAGVGGEGERRLEELGGAALAVGLAAEEAVDEGEVARIGRRVRVARQDDGPLTLTLSPLRGARG